MKRSIKRKLEREKLLELLNTTSDTLSMANKDNAKKDSVLEGTIFDHAEVVLADGNVIIAKNLIGSNANSYLFEKYYTGESIVYHEHYQDITNGIKFTSKDCKNLEGIFVIYDDIQKLGGISDYLTEEELNKSLTEKGLSNEEIVNIIKRIQKEVKENSKVLTKYNKKNSKRS